MELVANSIQLPQTSGSTTVEGEYILFGNEAARKAYCVFTMSIKLTEKRLYITSISRLHSCMTSYLEDMARKKNGVQKGGHLTVMFRNRVLKLLPLDMYNSQTDVFDHMKRHIPHNTAV